MIIVDTSIWSGVLRRANDPNLTAVITQLIANDQIVMLGPIRQEILSGIREPERFALLRTRLAVFADLALTREDYEEAAGLFNQCRAKGIQGSNVDFLICAVAIRRDLWIYTSDRDFEYFAQLLPLKLYSPSIEG